MALSHEDNLRLNVLFSQEIKAIRIDESAMTVHALTSKGEARIQLMPNCADERYLRQVRELFSTHVSDSPGGYPVYLKRWTRMGQTRTDSLYDLLLLGEPEAIVAVANAPGLTEEVARYAWWAMPTAEIARCLLENKEVSGNDIGKELAKYLLEFLPFEDTSRAIIDSVRLVLQPELLDEDERLSLWNRAGRKSSFYIGFLYALPDALPLSVSPNPLYKETAKTVAALCDKQNPYAQQLCRLLSENGQAFLSTVDSVLNRITDQDAVVMFLNCFGAYFSLDDSREKIRARSFSEIYDYVDKLLISQHREGLCELLHVIPEMKPQVRAMLGLCYVSETLADPIFAQTDAVGSVMRKQLYPVTEPLRECVAILQHA